MTVAVAPVRPRLALLGSSPSHAVLLADRTAAELLRYVLTPSSDLPKGGLPHLAQADPSLGAWLVDRLIGGSRGGWPLSATWDSAVSSTIAANEADVLLPDLKLHEALSRVSAQDLVDPLADSIVNVQLSQQDFDEWCARQVRCIRAVHDAVQRARPLNDLPDFVWWAWYLTAPRITPAQDGSVWRVHLAPPEPFGLPQHHPLHASMDGLRQSLERHSLDVERSVAAATTAEVDWSDEFPSLRALVGDVLQLARRAASLEDDFQATLEQEKLLAMKELAYGASHEINNPLANISSRAQLLLRDEADAERRRSLATINSQAFRAHEMIADMMLFAKPPILECETLNAAEYLGQVIDSLAAELPAGVRLDRDIQLGSWAFSGDAVQLTVAIRAIWMNSLESMGSQGHLRVAARVAPAGPIDRWSAWGEFEIADDGPGIRPEVRRHLFDPFYSGREAGRGLGFGLSKAWRIIQLHGGAIVVSSAAGDGASVTLRLPLIEPSPRQAT